jgi:hypothetical protein
MATIIGNSYGPHDERRTKTYRAYLRAYQNATVLHEYLYGRWLDGFAGTQTMHTPTMDAKFGIQIRNA